MTIKLNAFKVRPNKPMIDSLQSAKEFLTQCKVAFDVRIDKKNFITCFAGDDDIPCRVGVYELIDEWTDCQITAFYGIDAIKACYRLRKFINAKFK